MNRAVRTVTPVLLLFVASAATAQPGGAPAPESANLRGDSTQTRKRLAEAEQKLLAGKAADAIDDLQRVLDESPDDLIMFDNRQDRTVQYRTARWVIHSLLTKLPAEALRAYQDRIDQPAKKLLEQAKRNRDPRPLWQLLDRYFVSRPSEEALQLLGELLFERGEFRAAENQWRRLLPEAGADLTYPGAKADPALTRARIALAVIFQNHSARAAAEIAALKAKYPNATGTLAGKTGPLVTTLDALLAAPPKLLPDATSGREWPTFGGSPDRTARVPGGIPAWWPARPTWKGKVALVDSAIAGTPAQAQRQPFGHPVIVNGEVFVTDGRRLRGFDLQTGTPTHNFDLRSGKPVPDNEHLAAQTGAQCTLTAAEGLLYARTGPAQVTPPDAANTRSQSFLACIRPNPRELTKLWQLPPPEEEKVPASWEGAPLVAGRRLWAAYAKFEGGRVTHVLACYDPADPEKAPDRPAWVTELCDSPQPVSGPERTRQELLTLAGRHIVFCSNSGAVVAVDAATGRRAWGFRYPRARKPAPGASNDPAPAVAFAGRVFVAPADGERVYALDAETGKFAWESGETEGARILGVSRGRLIVAVAGPQRGIRGLNVETGSDRADGGWNQDSHGVLSYGQGLVTDDAILWPTRTGLYILDPTREGLPNRGAPIPLPKQTDEGFGHVAYADGVLVVVTPTQVHFYRAQSTKIESRPDATPRERSDALVDRAERELAAGNTTRAISALAELATGELPAPFRAWAAARMLQIAPPANDLSRLPSEVRAALNPTVLNEWVVPPDGVPVTLETFLQRRLGLSPAPGSLPTAAPVREPCPPGLTGDADVDRTLKLPVAVAPLCTIAGASCAPKHLFAAGPRVVVAVPLDQTAETQHTAADLFTHAADLRSGFVAAGPYAIAVYGPAREPLWVFRVPITDRLPDGATPFRLRCGHEPDCPHLSSFVLAGTWLLARVGEHHLLALDLTAHRVAWVLDSAGRASYEPNRFPGTPRFGPHFSVTGKFVVAQLSDGRRWFVDLRTGRRVVIPGLGEHTARVWWPHAPIEFGANRLLLADGPGLVRFVQPGGRVKWAFEVDREEGLTGQPAQVWGRGDVLLVAVERNHGVEIERVDVAGGKSVWSDGPTFADAAHVALTSIDADAERAYVPAANKLLALSLGTGKPVWEVDLPAAHGPRGWVVRAGKTCVIAYPAEAIPVEPPEVVLTRLGRSFAREPFLWRLPGLAGTLYDTWVARAVPVLLLDPKTGKRLGRVDVPARGPGVTASFSADATVIATGDRVVWLK
jgi:outer membrane protein assembly factor BamB